MAVTEKIYNEPYFTKYSFGSMPAEINLDGEIFSQTYVCPASDYQVEAMKGTFEIQVRHKFSQIFLNLVAAAPLFVVCIITLINNELGEYALGQVVSWIFTIISGIIFFYWLYRFLREGQKYHQVSLMEQCIQCCRQAWQVVMHVQ